MEATIATPPKKPTTKKPAAKKATKPALKAVKTAAPKKAAAPAKTAKAAPKKAVAKPAVKAVTKPAAKAAVKPAPKAAAKPAAKAAAKPAAKAVAKPADKAPAKPEAVAAPKAVGAPKPAIAPKPKAATVGSKISAKATELHKMILNALDQDKGDNIVSIDLSGKTALADYMVVVTGTSSRHVVGMAEKLKERLSKQGILARIEGKDTGDWVIVDAGDVIVHLFRAEVRTFYNLEKLWSTDFSTTDYTLYKSV